MATQTWRGDAPAVAQVVTLTPASVGIGNTFTATINGKSITYTAAAATVADVVSGLAALLSAATISEFAEVNWAANGTSNITGTAKTAGVPFTVTSGATGGSATLTTATPTASAGPADASTAANWSSGSLPTSGDNVVFAGTSKDCLYGLSALAGITAATLSIDMSYTGKIGLAYTNPSGYIEYRPRFFELPATLQTLGNGPGAGSGRINLDSGSVQTALTLNNSASPADTGFKTVNWKGTHAANVVNLNKGSFAAAFIEGDAAAIATLSVGYQTNQAGDVDALCGAGVTLTTINKTGGTLLVNSSFTTLNHGPGNAGECVLQAGTPGTINISGGNVRYRTAGNYTAITTTDSGYVDFAQGTGALTGTNTTCNPGQGGINDPGKRITFTNPISLSGQLSDYPNLDLGASFHIQRS